MSRPFERTAPENDKLLNCVKHFPELANQVSGAVLKELCVMAYLDVWKESQVTGKLRLPTMLSATNSVFC